MIDTCATREAFAHSEGVLALRQRHGLPEPSELTDHPVHQAFGDGSTG
jgi:hypothetical protein